MTQAMFKAVGPQPLREGYRDLLAYSTATILMLITLVLAALQFADWLLAPPECLLTNTSSMPRTVVSTAPTPSPRSDRYATRTEVVLKSSGCPCPP